MGQGEQGSWVRSRQAHGVQKGCWRGRHTVCTQCAGGQAAQQQQHSTEALHSDRTLSRPLMFMPTLSPGPALSTRLWCISTVNTC